ncbi:MAG: pyrroline-5-carboxylate reductase [Chloroflexi bacterium]|nr:pyrroline-5-carboxylate reductase [Chloroflexota bacterium]
MYIAFIGAGNMAEALIKGILRNQEFKPKGILVTDILPARLNYLHEKYAIAGATDNRRAIEEGELIVLAVKPQNLGQVAEELRGHFRPHQTILSIVAGAKMQTLTDSFGHRGVIRAMPNTPGQVGEGMSVWTAASVVSKEHRQAAQEMLEGLGKQIYVQDEKYLDMATALSASGPAFVLVVLEALIDAGVYIGLSREMARMLAVQTVLGSAALMEESRLHPGELRDLVASPGGTTVEGLLKLEQGMVRAHMIEAVVAAYRKTLLLGN